MLSTKDVLYLSDILDQISVLNQKITNDIAIIQDSNIKSHVEEINQSFVSEFDTLLNILKKESKSWIHVTTMNISVKAF